MSNLMQPVSRRALRLAVTQLRDVKVRTSDTGAGDGSWTIEGYAAVFEQETVLWEIPGWVRVREEIARDAFRTVLERLQHGDGLVHLNHGHDMKTAMASTDVDGIGRLDLDADFHGLRFHARVDPEDPDAKTLAVKMGRGVVRQASFAFSIAEEERVEAELLADGTWDEKWRILELAELYDVCVAAQGAYATTESHLRSLAAASLRVPDLGALGRAGTREGDPSGQPSGRAGTRDGDPSGRSLIAPVESEGEDHGRALELARLRAHAGAAYRDLTRRLD